MTLNNRIIRKTKPNPIKGGSPAILCWYDIHDVFYDVNGKVTGWTEQPIVGGFDTPDDARASLAQILRDICISPVAEIKRGKLVNRRHR